MSTGAYRGPSLCIDGEFIRDGGRDAQEIINPANLEVLGQVPHARRDDLDRALAAAQRAFQIWKQTSPMERSGVLRRFAELLRRDAADIARHITLDQGKPLKEALAEVKGCAEHAEWHAEEARRIYGRVIPARQPQIRQMVIRQPVGVCAAFTPWNFPLNQAIRKAAAAIGAGCAMIMKGPEESPSAVMAMARLLHEAGLPPGVLNLVWGVPAEISRYLIESPIVRKISFTGSVPVGKQLAELAGRHMKRVTMELGGHSPALVFADADVDAAAALLARIKTRNAGQVCVAPSRYYVQRAVYAQFAERYVAALGKVRVGDGLDPASDMGPLANARRLAAMQAFVADARAGGASILCGGERLDGKGYFFAPTVIDELPANARILHEEPFGPISPLIVFDEAEEAIACANSLPYGLSSYVFTRSLSTAHHVGEALEAGMVNINNNGTPPEVPFGGVKDSGIGSEGGTESFDGYLVTKFITQS